MKESLVTWHLAKKKKKKVCGHNYPGLPELEIKADKSYAEPKKETLYPLQLWLLLLAA